MHVASKGQKRNVFKILVGKHKGTRLFRTQRRHQKMILMVMFGPEFGPMAMSCENCKKDNHVTK
jgi:hypothetical protein